jgi:HSP20 family protein
MWRCDVDKNPKTGLEGLFRGLAGILQTVNDIAVRAGDIDGVPVDVRRTSSTGVPGAINVAYGAGLRVGARVAPPRRRMATLRHNAQREPIIDDGCEPIVDLLDEGDHYLVIGELPGVDVTALTWSIERGVLLRIKAESSERKYGKDLELPGPVNEEAAVCSFVNGVLELRLWKV